jgi:hypothetical protein
MARRSVGQGETEAIEKATVKASADTPVLNWKVSEEALQDVERIEESYRASESAAGSLAIG